MPTPTPNYLPDLDLNRLNVGFATFGTVQPFSARTGIGYQDLLETLRVYVQNDLYNYLVASDPQGTWDTNVDLLFSYIETQLNTVVDEIAAGQNAALNDATILSAIKSVNSTVLAYLDGRYEQRRTIVANRLAGWKSDGSADMAPILNAALAAVPAGSYVSVEILPSAFGKTTVRIDSTVIVDVSKAVITCPAGGVEFRATQMTGGTGGTAVGAAIRFRASTPVVNNSGWGHPPIGPFRLVGPGRSIVGSIGVYWHEPATGTPGNLRNLILNGVSIEEFEVNEQYGDNAYNIAHKNCVNKGYGKYGVWLPSAVTNTGERISYDDCVIQEGAVGSAAIQNDGGEIIFNHGSIDYVHGLFVANTGTARTEFYGTHFERSIATEGTGPWFTLSGGNLKFYGGTITGTGTYAAGTAPINLFMNTAIAAYTDGLILLDGVTFGNTLQVSSGVLCGGTGNIRMVNTQRQNQFQQAFLLSSLIMNLFTDQNIGTILMDEWFLTKDTAAITNTGRVVASVTGTNGALTIANGIKRNNNDVIKLNKTGAAGTAFAGAVSVPIRPGSSIGATFYVARNTALTGTFTMNMYYARVVSDANGPRIARSYVAMTKTVDTVNDLAVSGTFYEVDSALQVRRVPGWATHLVVELDLTAMGAGGIFFADPTATEF